MAHTNREMRELRTPLAGAVTYASGCGEAGRADWLNISRCGAALRLGRYLRPGRVIQLQPVSDEDWQIAAQITWCAPIPGTPLFKAGVAVQRTCPESALRFATLGYEAQAQNKSTNAKVSNNAVWPSFIAAPAGLPTRLNPLVRAV